MSLVPIVSQQRRLLPLCRRLVYKVSSYKLSNIRAVSDYSLAVRKNRYVILPVDFEEAWKVRCLVLFGQLASRLFQLNNRTFFFSFSFTSM